MGLLSCCTFSGGAKGHVLYFGARSYQDLRFFSLPFCRFISHSFIIIWTCGRVRDPFTLFLFSRIKQIPKLAQDRFLCAVFLR
ncbi:hypothetical protein GDO81_020748 [Engystomops pustulosus]|uniref:Uncharacterized protein n=1 Tax=Engystomops pustulosus TaxID=76066 RepID=A0AAV6YRI1_ENGPU|nr:hypothetical protein GDO81_020748 [Engystomops pustulosus]